MTDFCSTALRDAAKLPATSKHFSPFIEAPEFSAECAEYAEYLHRKQCALIRVRRFSTSVGQTVYDRCFQTNVAVVKITDREISCLFIIWTCQEYFFFAICLNGFYNVWPLMETGCWGLKPNIYKEQHSMHAVILYTFFHAYNNSMSILNLFTNFKLESRLARSIKSNNNVHFCRRMMYFVHFCKKKTFYPIMS